MSTDPVGRYLTRRELLTVGTGLFVVLSLPLALRRRVAPMARRSLPLMGTVAEVQVAHRDPAVAHQAIDAAFRELNRIESLMTRFRPESDIGRANLGAGRDGVVVSAETAQVVEAALAWAATSEGRFDPALGAASELWDVLERREPPPDASVRRLARRGFWRDVDVARTSRGGAIRFDQPDLHLDLGGIAKGYGIDRAVAVLREHRIAHAVVTVGGDLFALGTAPDGDPWLVGIREPDDPNGLAGRLTVVDRAVTTSGDYQRYFTWHGTRYHHLIDPLTAAPRRTAIRSLTVVGTDAMNADAAATAAFGLELDAARALVRRRIPSAEVHPLT